MARRPDPGYPLDRIVPKIIIVLTGTINRDKDSGAAILGGIRQIAAVIKDKLKHTRMMLLRLLP